MQELVQEKVLNYYGINDYKEIIWVDTLKDYANKFLKRFVEDNVRRTVKSDVKGNGKGNNSSKYVFRGMSRADNKYSGVTTAIYDNGQPPKDIYENLNKELLLIRKFQQNAPNAASYDALDLVAMAQHNGLKTRLIDWTRSPLVATLFALYDAPGVINSREKNWCGYYLVGVCDIKEHIEAQGGLPLNDGTTQVFAQPEAYIIYGEMLKYITDIYEKKERKEVETYFDRLLSSTNTKYMLNKLGVDISRGEKAATVKKLAQKFMDDKIFFLETNFANTRISAQRGLFQLSVSPYKKYIDNCYSNVYLIFISQQAREFIKKYCYQLGMNNYALMPDNQSVAKEINREPL